MLESEDLFDKYDFLLPGRYDGGFLVLALFEKIAKNEIPEYFSDTDIRRTLEQLAVEFNQGISQADRITRHLNLYFIKSVPDQLGKYFLSDYAKRLVELLKNKLENPHRNFPLKKTFDKCFTIRTGQIRSIIDLELRYGRDFVAPHKSIIENHLDALYDELQEATGKLGDILISEELTAIQMVSQFVAVFNQFGERAEDMGNAIVAKDRFLKSLNDEANKFYQLILDAKNPESDRELADVAALNTDWNTASAIYNDLSDFFEKVDRKLAMMHQQILFASEKLYELQENFSSRSNFRLSVKKLLNNVLGKARYGDGDVKLPDDYLPKYLPYVRVQVFFPAYYYFDVHRPSYLIEIARDEAYEQEQLQRIVFQALQADKINNWLQLAKKELTEGREIVLSEWLKEVMVLENNVEVALYAGFELVQLAISSRDLSLTVNEAIENIEELNLQLWNIRITGNQEIIAS